MKFDRQLKFIVHLIICWIFLSNKVFAANVDSNSIYIATAANFTETLQEIVMEYNKIHPKITIKISNGATTNLYSQISNGAPFDIFFSSDEKFADLLIERKLASLDNNFIYAKGRLVLWCFGCNIKNDGEKILRDNNFKHLAIANPKSAPYGAAAIEVLQNLGITNINKLVYGQDVSGAMNFVVSKNAELGFVALSQMIAWQNKNNSNLENEIWLVPADLYRPINQKVVLLNNNHQENAIEFLNFIKSRKAQHIIKKFGYN